MERLTGRDAYGDIVANEEMQIIASRGTTYDDLHNIINHLAEKLCEYEDLEEKGRLIRLPCNIGDKLYYIDENNPDGNEIIKCIVTGFRHNRRGIGFIIGDYFDGEGTTYEIGIKPSEIGVNAFYNEAEAYAKLDLRVTIGQTLYVIPEDGQDIRKAEVVSINPHYYNDAGFKLSEMSSKDYEYYLDIKVRYLDDIHVDLPVTVIFRPKDFEDGIIFTTQEKAEEKLERLKGEINKERD
jgi:hypothetical protein